MMVRLQVWPPLVDVEKLLCCTAAGMDGQMNDWIISVQEMGWEVTEGACPVSSFLLLSLYQLGNVLVDRFVGAAGPAGVSCRVSPSSLFPLWCFVNLGAQLYRQ